MGLEFRVVPVLGLAPVVGGQDGQLTTILKNGN